MSNKTSADQVFGILAFQYKPLETAMLKFCRENDQLKVISTYEGATAGQKIRILDRFASFLGL